MRVTRSTALKIIVATLVFDAIVVAVWLRRSGDPEQAYDHLIEKAAARHDVPPSLVKAVVWRESLFDPTARGGSGEIGLMQVTPPAGEDWSRATGRDGFRAWILWDPGNNLNAGSWYLGRALRRWTERDDPVPFALAEYNAGPSNATRWAGKARSAAEFLAAIDYPTTRKYIEVVTRRADRYRRLGQF